MSVELPEGFLPMNQSLHFGAFFQKPILQYSTGNNTYLPSGLNHKNVQVKGNITIIALSSPSINCPRSQSLNDYHLPLPRHPV
jgi:hypothetical protein